MIEALPLIWAGVIAFGVTLYVLLDGFSLGVGILFPFVGAHEDRTLAMNSVAPVWDGNQTWLVLGGAALFAAFPPAFNFLLGALYLPLMVMLVALIFRGAAFEFRYKAADSHGWDRAFAAGSTIAAFCQGMVLGTYVTGFDIVAGHHGGGAFAWLTPFSLFTGLAVVGAYGLLGACWLVVKTEGPLQLRARELALRLLWVALFSIAVVSIWTPFVEPAIAERWFAWPNLFLLAPVPLLTAVCAIGLYLSLRRGGEVAPFAFTAALFLLTLAGLAISLWPWIVPRTMTVWEAAAAPKSQLFVLVGVAIIVPLILIYTAHAYWVFRGKVDRELHY